MTFKTVFLTGFRSVGKSTIGASLAKDLNFKFIDLDNEIEKHSQKKIHEIVNEPDGWIKFRNIELDVLKNLNLNTLESTVIALGGGTAVHDDNKSGEEAFDLLKNLRDDSFIINLSGKFSDLKDLVNGGGKPKFLQDEEQVFNKRIEKYAKLSDFTFFTYKEGNAKDYAMILARIIRKEIKVTILLGNPITHSKSPELHNFNYKKLNIEKDFYYSYKNIEEKDLSSYFNKIKKNLNLRSITLTVPHKENSRILLGLKEEDFPQEVKAYGCNTIIFNDGEKTVEFFQTDIHGLSQIFENIKKNLKKNILILGSGGVVRALLKSLFLTGVTNDQIILLARNERKRTEIAKLFNIMTLPWTEDSFSKIGEVSLIVNGTPIGMKGDFLETKLLPDTIFNNLNQDAIYFDLVYTPRETKTIIKFKSKGFKTISGDALFFEQAKKQFEFITERKIDEFNGK